MASRWWGIARRNACTRAHRRRPTPRCAWRLRTGAGPGVVDGKPVVGYRQEERVHPRSQTETYAALRVEIENWRWAGVPIYVRAGKRMAKRVTEITIQFKQPPLLLFKDSH